MVKNIKGVKRDGLFTLIAKTGLVLSAAVLLTSETSLAVSKTFFDFDNTVTENREQYSGTFQTHVILYRVTKRANLFQSEINSPAEITVSWADYERLKPYLSKTMEGQGGTVGKKIKLTDGRTFEPAHFYVRNDDSFKYFFEGPKGENYLLQDYLRAKAVRGKAGKWKGKAWGVFQMLMSDPQTAQDTGFITMRAHSKKEWNEFFEQLIKDGEIKYAPNLDMIVCIPRPENDRYTYYYKSDERMMAKVNFLEEYIQMLGRVEVADADYRLGPDGKSYGQYSQLIVAEDNQQVHKAFAQLFQKYAQGKQFKIKFGLINTGYQSEVDETRMPRFTFFENNGTARRATVEEVIGKKKPGNAAEKCALTLLKAGLAE